MPSRRDCQKVCDVLPIWLIIMSHPSLWQPPFLSWLQVWPSWKKALNTFCLQTHELLCFEDTSTFTKSFFCPVLTLISSIENLLTDQRIGCCSGGSYLSVSCNLTSPPSLWTHNQRQKAKSCQDRILVIIMQSIRLDGGELFILVSNVASLPLSQPSN